MPLIKVEQINPDASWCLWRIEESIDSLRNSTCLSSWEKSEFQKFLNEKRKKEWLGARNALKVLLNQHGYTYNGLEKTRNRKPVLKNIPINISLSHCYPYAVAIIHKKSSCGIDIEKINPSLLKVSDRFLTVDERSFIGQDLDGLCIAWTAKESVYKMYGDVRLSFRRDMNLLPYKPRQKGEIKALVRKDDHKKDLRLYYCRIEEYFICFSYW
jgi:phosphopantetheinyl transferase